MPRWRRRSARIRSAGHYTFESAERGRTRHVGCPGRDHSSEGERFLHETDVAEYIVKLLETTSKLLAKVAACIASGRSANIEPELLGEVSRLNWQIHLLARDSPSPIMSDIGAAVDTLAGQLRAVTELTSYTTRTALEEYVRHELAQPWRYQLRSWFATLWANLDLRSAFFRHAIRLAVWVTLGDAIGRAINGQRAYWIAMTIAVVLKPDFTVTFSRGVLRLGVHSPDWDWLTSILASSHALTHAIMAMEARTARRRPQTPPEPLESFANDVEFTLYYLSTALRGPPAAT